MKKLKTKLHFNRVNMQRKSPRVWTASNSRGCVPSEKILILHNGVVLAETVFRPEARQPRAYLLVRGEVKPQADGITVVVV